MEENASFLCLRSQVRNKTKRVKSSNTSKIKMVDYATPEGIASAVFPGHVDGKKVDPKQSNAAAESYNDCLNKLNMQLVMYAYPPAQPWTSNNLKMIHKHDKSFAPGHSRSSRLSCMLHHYFVVSATSLSLVASTSHLDRSCQTVMPVVVQSSEDHPPQWIGFHSSSSSRKI